MTKPTTACLLLCLALGAWGPGCRSTSKNPNTPATDVPADFTMVFGAGGGFAGRWEGYTIAADGAVRAWSGFVAGENEQPAGTLTADQRAAIWQRVEAAGFFAQDRLETGNMTAFMEITADGRAHRVSWIPRIENVEEITDPVEQLYAYCRDLARRAGAD